MWNLKEQMNEQAKKRITPTNWRTNQWLPKGRGVGEWAKWVKGSGEIQLPITE